LCFFFFQAEDGIRDRNVTGVQTCALPILDALVTERKVQRVLGDYKPGTGVNYPGNPFAASLRNVAALIAAGLPTRVYFVSLSGRSEERRVGKECRTRGVR